MKKPILSVVSVSAAGTQSRIDCLASIEKQYDARRMEVLVGTDAHDEGARALAARFPFARIIEISRSLSVPAQRSLGIRAARGDIIVLTEDHCTPAADWAERILETEASDEAAVGGRVENSRQS